MPAYNNLLDETKCSTLMYMQEYSKTVERLCEVRQSQLATTPMLQKQDFDLDGIPEARIKRTALNARLASRHTAFVMHVYRRTQAYFRFAPTTKLLYKRGILRS